MKVYKNGFQQSFQERNRQIWKRDYLHEQYKAKKFKEKEKLASDKYCFLANSSEREGLWKNDNKLIRSFLRLSSILVFYKRVNNGYIAKISDSENGISLWVIELDAKQSEGKTKEQGKRLLKEEAAKAAGTYS